MVRNLIRTTPDVLFIHESKLEDVDRLKVSGIWELGLRNGSLSLP